MFPSLVMAFLSSQIPGFGLLGSIIKYISSDDPSSGRRFVADLVTSVLPGNFLTGLATGVAVDVFLGSDLGGAFEKVAPYNEVAATCNYCYTLSHYYVRHNGHLICPNCMSRNLAGKMRYNDKIYILKNGLYQLHGELKTSNELLSRTLSSQQLSGRTLKGKSM